jgi:hypothetical protein
VSALRVVGACRALRPPREVLALLDGVDAVKTYRVGRVELRVGQPDELEEIMRPIAEALRVLPQYRPFLVARLRTVLEEWLEILRAEQSRL